MTADGSLGITRRQAKDRLRLANAEAAKDIARVSGLSYAAVNLELNRSAGLRRVTEATEQQLQVPPRPPLAVAPRSRRPDRARPAHRPPFPSE